jgi:hypothetical protein
VRGTAGRVAGGYAASEVCLYVARVGAAGILEGAVVVRLAAEVSWCITVALGVVLYAGSSSVLCCEVEVVDGVYCRIVNTAIHTWWVR